jgi:hypothetical protein
MRSVPAPPRALHPAGIHPALWRFAEECNGLLARLLGYMGALALITIVVVSLWDDVQLPAGTSPGKSDWSIAARAWPAFAVSQADLFGKTAVYEILQHPAGGRKDVLRWARDDKAVAELEVYRPGREVKRSGPPVADIAGRIDPGGARELQAAGLVDSKFGTVALLGLIDRGGEPACLGFIKQFAQPDVQISGWSCQGDTLPARRAAIGCMLNRLVLLAAGNDTKLAELFAHAELKRGECTPGAASPARSADWVTGAQNPQLRGGL